MEERRTSVGKDQVRTHWPPANMNVIVITPDYRCLGFRDGNGVWRRTLGKEEINNVTAWEPVEKSK